MGKKGSKPKRPPKISSITAEDEDESRTPLLSEAETTTNKNENGGQKEELEAPLPQDIYSLIYTSEYNSSAFVYGLIVFGVQLTIILMIMHDLVDLNDKDNPFKVAPGVTLEVTIAQSISTILAVATQTNLLTALSRASEGYDPNLALAVNPCCTWNKFLLITRLQFLVGILYLADNFILNMQSETVLDLMMNFAALAFISDIQDLAFWLAHRGFLTKRIQNETYQVEKFELPIQHKKRKVARKRFLFGVITTLLLVLYAMVVHQQRSGKFLCKKIFVQFGDAYRPDLPQWSGIYVQGSYLLNGRAVYVDPKGQSNARFAFCDKENAWTFTGGLYASHFDPDEGVLELRETSDPCDYWVKSSETGTFDITETTSSPWWIGLVASDDILPLELFTLNCHDCGGFGSSSITGASCSGHGGCIDNQCVCDPGHTGYYCEYGKHSGCSTLELDERTLPFPFSDSGVFRPSTSYELLLEDTGTPVLIYNKPVYVSEVPSQPDMLNIILFTGRRWGVTLNVELTDTDLQSREDLPRYLTKDFHGWLSRYHIYFFSGPVDVGTPSDTISPSDLPWYRARKWLTNGDKIHYKVDSNHPTGTVLLCPDCQSVANECFNGGECQRSTDNSMESNHSRRECKCPIGTSGLLCERELACFDDGVKCFNRGKCNKRTGDCSCRDSHTGRLCQYSTTCTIDPSMDAQSCISIK